MKAFCNSNILSFSRSQGNIEETARTWFVKQQKWYFSAQFVSHRWWHTLTLRTSWIVFHYFVKNSHDIIYLAVVTTSRVMPVCSNQDALQYLSSWVGKCDWAPVVLKHAKYLGSKIDPRYQIIVATHSAKCKVLCEKCAELLKTDTKSTSNLCRVYRRHVYMR